jgi:nitroimidazol reductase NimA-like FMN-containing flavoprotein (pyridoxamine 5'-phosphate oxidase superfamily)
MNMFRELRRTTQQLSRDVALQYLRDAEEGVLSTISVDNGYPYGIAVNHVLMNDALYFHCANEGHKVDNMKANPAVSYFIIHKKDIDQERYTTTFESVHVFGKASIVTNPKEKYDALLEIARKFTGAFAKHADREIKPSFDRTTIVRIDIEHIEGKQSKNT